MPGIITFLLLFFQLILLFHAELVTSYSAFCAVRAAIVLSPRQLRSLAKTAHPMDSGAQTTDQEDVERVRRAAAIALIPISPIFSPRLAAATQSLPSLEQTERLSALGLLFPPQN